MRGFICGLKANQEGPIKEHVLQCLADRIGAAVPCPLSQTPFTPWLASPSNQPNQMLWRLSISCVEVTGMLWWLRGRGVDFAWGHP